MKFTFKVWVLAITIDLFDIDPSDGDITFSVKLSWK